MITDTDRAPGAAAPALLELRDVRKYFPLKGGTPWSRPGGDVRAVDGVSLSLAAGETLSLVGESGCGKTTTANLVLKLERPDAGEIRFNGKDITQLAGSALRRHRASVQAVFQDPWGSLNPRMRVQAIISEPLVINTGLRGAALRNRVAELLEAVGLSPAAARDFPHEFSGGQRQRIAVARAISVEPELVVLDEPVSALDVSIRAQIMNLLKDLQESLGVGYLIIAHDLATVRYLSHRVAVMYLGQIVEYADAETLFNEPRHPYTRALISAAKPAAAESSGTEIILHGEVPSPADPPPGCRFHTRCWLYQRLGDPEICRTREPVLRQVDASTDLAACHFSEQMD